MHMSHGKTPWNLCVFLWEMVCYQLRPLKLRGENPCEPITTIECVFDYYYVHTSKSQTNGSRRLLWYLGKNYPYYGNDYMHAYWRNAFSPHEVPRTSWILSWSLWKRNEQNELELREAHGWKHYMLSQTQSVMSLTCLFLWLCSKKATANQLSWCSSLQSWYWSKTMFIIYHIPPLLVNHPIW